MSEETLNDAEGSLTEPVETVEAEVTIETKADTTPETKVEQKVEVKADVKTDTKTVEPDWPSDWREKATGGDAKAMAKIAKYASPKALAEALLSAQDYISKTRSVAKLGKDATADQIKAYRESLGVPEVPDKYDLKDMNLKEGDKPLLDATLRRPTLPTRRLNRSGLALKHTARCPPRWWKTVSRRTRLSLKSSKTYCVASGVRSSAAT